MNRFCFIIILLPIFTFCQSGISLSGGSQFYNGQIIIPANNGVFNPINYQSRDNTITLSIFRGRKFKIGTLALNANLSYSINNIHYKPEENNLNIPNYETIKKSLIPRLELWYIMFQTEKTFIYTSLGGYGIIQDINIFASEEENNLYEYNGLIPFIRTGMQVNYGRFFINPFISFDLQEINYNNISDVLEINIKETVSNYNIRSGLEFGIMF